MPRQNEALFTNQVKSPARVGTCAIPLLKLGIGRKDIQGPEVSDSTDFHAVFCGSLLAPMNVCPRTRDLELPLQKKLFAISNRYLKQQAQINTNFYK
ncbi:MAG: hypothetical protein AAFY05_00030 [Pseudomonadota bacterium]